MSENNINKKQIRKIYDIGEVPHYKELAERFIFPFPQMNYLLNGGVFDRVTMITSGTDNGKTTISSQIIASCLDQGYKCCCFFGEDTARESQDRIFKQAASKDQICYKAYEVNGKNTNCGEYFLTDEGFENAKRKYAGKLFLYNTLAEASVDQILEGFEEARIKYGCRIFLLDNVDQFEFSSENENKAIKDIVIKIRDYAINKKVHIFLVAHIRKIERDVIVPDLNDVKGTSSMVNVAKNVMIVIRMDKIDKNTKQYKALKEVIALNNYNLDEADCLVKIAKTKGRKIGWVCLKFNKTTQTYYECRKINPQKEDNDAAVMFSSKKNNIEDLEEITFDNGDDDLPF